MEEDLLDDQAMMVHFGAIKIQAIARMIIQRSRVLKYLNDRYEKIYDPKRERYYYYDKVTDNSSWGKPVLLLKSDIKVISPTFAEGEEAQADDAVSVLSGDADQHSHETGDESEDESGTDDGEGESKNDRSGADESDVDSDDSAAVRERRRLRRKYPRSKAQERVDAAEDDLQNTQHLDLSGLGATRVTSRIYDLVELRELNLSHNKLARISPNIQYFQLLEKLEVQHNRLPTLPKELQELSELKHLDVSHNEIATYPGRVYKLAKLEHLNLSHNPMRAIPSEVGNLELLAELGQWEVGISLLSRLRHLDVSHCDLFTWPAQVAQLYDLQYLDLSSNTIDAVPSDVADLQSLRTLLMRDCGVTRLSPDIYNLPKLERLDLSRNALTELPPPRPSNLATDPPERIMEGLRTLDVSHNQLTALGDVLGVFQTVTHFDASHNQITAFEGESISKLTALSVLDMSHNELEYFPLGLRSCTALTKLVAHHNKLDFVPETLVYTTKMMHIDLSYNEISDAAGKIFAMLSHLQVLMLQHNKIGTLPSMLYTVRNLQHLDLSHNEVPEIMEGLGQLCNLTYLNLSHNKIASIPESISQLTQLKTIELEGNRLTSLPQGLGKLYRTLGRVSLSHNDFTASPELLRLLPLLVTCNLSWNPRLRGQWIDWTAASAEYKPKKVFIPVQILLRRVEQTVTRLDSAVRALPAPPNSEVLYHSAAEARAAKLAAEESELADFQSMVADDDSEAVAAGTAGLKAARKVRVRNAKRLKQSLDWHAALRKHLVAYAYRQPTQGEDRLNTTTLTTPLPTVDDLRRSQTDRLASTMAAVFAALQRQFGSAVIGVRWEQALEDAGTDLLADRKCAELLCELPIAGELQDSIEALQYLVNECDALLMVADLRHMMECHARRVNVLRSQQREDEAVQGIAGGIKTRLGVLSGAAKRAVQDRHSGDAPTNIDAQRKEQPPALSVGGRQGRHRSQVTNQMTEDTDAEPDYAATADGVDVEPTADLAGLSPRQALSTVNEDAANDTDAPAADDADEGGQDATPPEPHSPDEVAGDSTLGGEAVAVEPSQPPERTRTTDRKPSTTNDVSRTGSRTRSTMSRKEVAAEQVDLLTRNVKVDVKVKRVANTLAEEAARLNKQIAEAMDQLQKPQLMIDFAGLPYLAFSPVAVEGIFPGIPKAPNTTAGSHEALLGQLVDLCLHLIKALLLRCDALRDCIRLLEVRAALSHSSLDIAQRSGTDFQDLMSDVYDELTRAVEVKELASGAGAAGGKGQSIFKRASTMSSMLFTAAMAGTDEGTEHSHDSDGEGTAAGSVAGTATGTGAGDDAASEGTPATRPTLTRSSTATSGGDIGLPRPGTSKSAPKVPLSSILKAVDKSRVLKDPVDAARARKCIQHLLSHRVLTYMWVAYISEIVAGILRRRGVDVLYPLFKANTQQGTDPAPEWAMKCAARLAQFRGAMFQGLSLFARAVEEYSACAKFSASARSLPYYKKVIKLQLAQGNFKLARNAVYDCLRRHYTNDFSGFDLTDETAMPEPLEVLSVDKELALLYALAEEGMKHLNAAQVFTAPYHRFLSVQDNGLLSATSRVPVEVQRGLTPLKLQAMKVKQEGMANALSALHEREEREQTRAELKDRIAEARLKATTALSTAP